MTKKLSAIIVDDERLSRQALKSIIAELEQVEIVGEADNVQAAIVLIDQTQPDIIFLDIQMPGESGFDLLEKINIKAKIIFITAYDEFALRAFEVNALDYLMKPVSPARLKAALDRLNDEEQIDAKPKRRLTNDDRLFIQFRSNYIFLKIDTITHISSAGDYSEVFLNDCKHGLTNKSMQEWEDRLPENNFCRIHRSTIINIDFVVKVEDWFNNSFRVYLKGVEEPFSMSRRYASQIKGRMG
jgi:two-component system, LytTR family, response regulator